MNQTRIFKYAIKNILRNKFLSISTVLVLVLLMFFVNLLIVIHNVSFKLMESINSKMTISLYLKDEYDNNSLDVIKMNESIKNLSSTIKIQYKNKQEVLEEVRKKDPDIVSIIEADGINPLPATIYISEVSINEYEKLNSILATRTQLFAKGKGNKLVGDYNYQYDRINAVVSVIKTLQVALYMIIAVFIFSISIIVYSIISNFIFYYKDEIYITKLVGGSNLFIYGPFSVQGVVYTFISFAISFWLFNMFVSNINFVFANSDYKDLILNTSMYNVFLIEGLIFMLVGGASGYLSSRKYLK